MISGNIRADRGASVNAVESHRETALMLSADLADGLAAAALLIEHGGRGVFPFCRRRSHSEGIGRVAETVQAYFARDVDEGKRKELTRCVSEREQHTRLDGAQSTLHRRAEAAPSQK